MSSFLTSIRKRGIKWTSRWRIHRLQRLYRDRPYHEFYAAVMNERIRVDPRYAVGGLWEEIGRLQFEYLVAKGLEPGHRLLDFGCGSLRGGLHFIGYLDPGNYTGVDISAEALAIGEVFLAESGLDDRQPELIRIGGLDLAELDGRCFDYLLAHSVLTHMPPTDIGALFRSIRRVMVPESRFFATYFDGGGRYHVSADHLDFHYPFDRLAGMAAENGLVLTRDASYSHPRGQVMVEIRI